MLEPPRASIADPELPERGVAHHVPVGREALLENLLAVGDEQEPVTREARPQPRVVDRRHHRLPGTRCGDEKVAVVALLSGREPAARATLPETAEARSRSG